LRVFLQGSDIPPTSRGIKKNYRKKKEKGNKEQGRVGISFMNQQPCVFFLTSTGHGRVHISKPKRGHSAGASATSSLGLLGSSGFMAGKRRTSCKWRKIKTRHQTTDCTELATIQTHLYVV
jgi:hypothetical protein